MSPFHNNLAQQPYFQPGNEMVDWKPFGQEFSIRTALQNTTRELALQQIAFRNLERDMQSHRRDVGESLTCIQVDVNGTMTRFQTETRKEMQNLHETLTDRIRNQDVLMEREKKQNQQQYFDLNSRLDHFEEACSQEHGHLREKQDGILDQLKNINQKIVESKNTHPFRENVNTPGNATPQQNQQGTLTHERTNANPVAGRECCPYCGKNLSKNYIPRHIRTVCRK